jgi:hypothetical protein
LHQLRQFRQSLSAMPPWRTCKTLWLASSNASVLFCEPKKRFARANIVLLPYNTDFKRNQQLDAEGRPMMEQLIKDQYSNQDCKHTHTHTQHTHTHTHTTPTLTHTHIVNIFSILMLESKASTKKQYSNAGELSSLRGAAARGRSRILWSPALQHRLDPSRR